MITLLYGEDDFSSSRHLEKIKNDFEKKDPSRMNAAVFDVEDAEFKTIKEAVRAMPFLAEERLIVVKNLATKGSKDMQEKFAELIKSDQIPKVTRIVFYESGKIKKNTKIYKALNKAGELCEFSLLQGFKLNQWIEKEVQGRGGKIDKKAVEKLAAFVGGELWQQDLEIDKLISYKQKELILPEDVGLLVRARIDDNIFKFVDALGAKNRKESLRLLHDQIELGSNEIYLLTMIIYQLRNLISVKSLSTLGCNQNQISKQAGIHPYVVSKTLNQASRFDLSRLKAMYKDLLEADISFKTKKTNPKLLLDMLVLKFCS